MSLFSFSSRSTDMPNNWGALSSVKALDTIIQASHEKPQLLFKHSTRCGISVGALDNMIQAWDLSSDEVDVHILDLLNHRDVSAAIAEKTGIPHQSPQAILLVKGKVAYHKTHHAISADAVKAVLV